MPPKAESSTAYRDKSIDEDDDDDLDDLDDVLASFNKPRAEVPKSEPVSPAPKATGKAARVGDDEEDFEASLVEGMESLLRQLAGDNPPGPMPGSTSTAPSSPPTSSSATGAYVNGRNQPSLSAEEEEKAFQRAIEMMLSKEGLDALGLDEGGDRKPPISPSGIKQERSTSPSSSSHSKSKARSQPTWPEVSSFEDTIKKAMESLNTAGDKKPGSTGASGPNDPANLARLLAQLGNDPNLDLEGDDELSGILDGMMGQLMTREVLEEPMAELASKYPDYLASPPASTPPADLEKYRQQYAIVQKIVDTFRKPGYSDDKDGKEIAKLVGEMQDLGGPPQEIMGELPEGFDLGALAGDESCTIM